MSTEDSVTERGAFRQELATLDIALNDLKLLYEKHFLAVLPFAPDKELQEFKARLRALKRAPFKNSEIAYRIRALETRFSTLNTYWQRIIRERENGNYAKDIFKAGMRERHAFEDARKKTETGVAESSIKSLFNSYRSALERNSDSSSQQIDFGQFQKKILAQAREFRSKNGSKKLAFAVVVKEGKVSLKAKAVE
jgi:hypothetical protein